MSPLVRIYLSISSCMLNLESAQYGMAWLCTCVLCACVLARVRRVCVLVCCVCVCVLGCCVCFCVPGFISYLMLKTDEQSPLLNLKAAHIYQMALTVAAV